MQHTPPEMASDELPVRATHPLRVAMVTETYPPEVNGVANTVARAVEGLRLRGHRVQVVRPRQARDADQAEQDAAPQVLTRGMTIPMYGHLRMGLPCRGELSRLWQRQRPDIVHIATEGPLGWSALQAALGLGLPVCSDFRTNFQAYSQFYGMGWLQRPITAYLRAFHNRGHATMVPTDALRRQLALLDFASLSVVARGVDTRLFSPTRRSAALRETWKAQDDTPVVLHVGRLAPEKNLPVLVRSFQRIAATHPGARLVVVGDGPSRAELQQQCPQVIFAGFRRGEDLAAHYASSDVFLFPSLTETYGNVTPEAMASALAVVAFDDAAAGQLIAHGHSGLLAPKTEPDTFASHAQVLVADADMRRRLRMRARARAMGLSWDSVVRSIEDVYATALPRTGIQAGRLQFTQAPLV